MLLFFLPFEYQGDEPLCLLCRSQSTSSSEGWIRGRWGSLCKGKSEEIRGMICDKKEKKMLILRLAILQRHTREDFLLLGFLAHHASLLCDKTDPDYPTSNPNFSFGLVYIFTLIIEIISILQCCTVFFIPFDARGNALADHWTTVTRLYGQFPCNKKIFKTITNNIPQAQNNKIHTNKVTQISHLRGGSEAHGQSTEFDRTSVHPRLSRREGRKAASA